MRQGSLASLAVAAAVALAVGGCALPKERAAAGERWIRDDSPEGPAKLVLGVPETDALRVMMTCLPRSGAVDITIVGRTGDPAVLELHSGPVWNRYLGAGHASEENEGAVDIDLKLAAADPVLQSLADTGGLTVILGERIMVLPNAFAPAHDFLAVCRLP